MAKPAAKKPVTKKPAAKKPVAKKPVAKEPAVAKKPATKKPAAPSDGADPRFLPVVHAFRGTPGFSLMESKSGAIRGLVLNGKSFGMSSHGRLMLKLNEVRAAALIADGTGTSFSPSAGRVMKGWLEVTSAKADWVALAREAHQLAMAAAGKKKP